MRIGDRGEDAMACLDRAQTIATENNFNSILAKIHFLRGNLYFPLGRIAECRTEHETSLRHARESGSHEAEARALGGLGDATYAAGHMRTANKHFSHCVELSVAHGLRRIEVSNRPMVAWTEFYLNRLNQANDTGLSAVEAALATGNSRAEIVAHNLLSEIAYLRGETSDVKLHGERAYELAHRIGATLFEAYGAFSRGRCQSSEDGDNAAAFASFLEAYEVSQATAESFMGPWILGSAARVAGKDEDRDWSLREGERILDAGAVSHNYFFFYINAMDARLDVEDWDEVRRYAAALENYTAKEPLEWSDFFIKRGRALANFGLGKRDQATIDALKDLRDVARRVGFTTALPPIEAALAKAGA
jgi:tetratricopeptide (TPR) repeat protein